MRLPRSLESLFSQSLLAKHKAIQRKEFGTSIEALTTAISDLMLSVVMYIFNASISVFCG